MGNRRPVGVFSGGQHSGWPPMLFNTLLTDLEENTSSSLVRFTVSAQAGETIGMAGRLHGLTWMARLR